MARFLLLFVFVAAPCFARECVPFEKAPDHIGKTVCISGTVLKVAASESGSMFLDFCEDYRKCAFTVVVFRRDLFRVGDVRVLEGKPVEITGKVKKYRGRAEIILRDPAQLEGGSGALPEVPRTYDADRRGSFSAGKFDTARSKHQTHRRSTRPSEGEIDDE
ncbi:MAG TPA: hypothetical protein VN577_15825 [Terriglobales bacterium]|nr:hypothetical protein [Terriglobales bacterium]